MSEKECEWCGGSGWSNNHVPDYAGLREALKRLRNAAKRFQLTDDEKRKGRIWDRLYEAIEKADTALAAFPPPGDGVRAFYLDREDDATGISGTGRVAQGAIFDDGTVVMRWLTRHRSTCFYSDIREVEAIHGHNGSTKIVFGPCPRCGALHAGECGGSAEERQ